MHSANRNKTRFLLDTNILVDFALDVVHEQLNENERAAANFARKLVLMSNCKLLIPEITGTSNSRELSYAQCSNAT